MTVQLFPQPGCGGEQSTNGWGTGKCMVKGEQVTYTFQDVDTLEIREVVQFY